MGRTTKRWKNFWDQRRKRKAEKLRHPEVTKPVDQAEAREEAFWDLTPFRADSGS